MQTDVAERMKLAAMMEDDDLAASNHDIGSRSLADVVGRPDPHAVSHPSRPPAQA